MGDQDNYEGIDFRVKEIQKVASVTPFVRWTITGIAVVSSVLVLIQFRDSYNQRHALLDLQRSRQREVEASKKINEEKDVLQKQLNESNNMIIQLKQELENCPHPPKKKQTLPSHKGLHQKKPAQNQ